MTQHPLVVDLDGTLINTNLLHECAIDVLKKKPLQCVQALGWLLNGKASLKQHLAQHANLDPKLLPYNHALLEWLTLQRQKGRRLILCTGSHHSMAKMIAQHLGLFDDVFATDDKTNLVGQHKAALLVQQFGERGFDYVGNAWADLAVWRCARRAIIVNAPRKLIEKTQHYCDIETIIPKPNLTLKTFSKALRVHQWLKNSLVFIPILAAHQLTHLTALTSVCMGFVAFCACASAVYVLNDLVDLELDRQHPSKCRRPFAAGIMPVWSGLVMAPILLICSFLFASAVNTPFMACLSLYFILTCTYSLGIKRLVLVDCIMLALLYTLRIIAGAIAMHAALSFWLLTFSVFLFLSLAFIKRYTELRLTPCKVLPGRGYMLNDAPLIQNLGISSSFAAVVVLALYINSDAILKLYNHPEIIWGTVPVMLFWNSWMWLNANRGTMHEDPILFAVKDKTSYVVGFIFLVILMLGCL